MKHSARTKKCSICQTRRFQMKRRLFHLLFLVAIGVSLAPTSVWAQSPNPSINRIERRDQARIRQGIRSGELTRQEARRLEAEQARIRVNERFDQADGKLSSREHRQLQKELHRASRDIYRQKHDGQS